MEIELLKEGYKNDENFFTSFKNNSLLEDGYISSNTVFIQNIPDFPIYLGSLYFGKNKIEEKKADFRNIIAIMEKYVLDMDRDIYMDERFWHSYICIYKRDYIIQQYPKCLDNYSNFKKIVIKDFNWENFIYKAILAAQYVNDIVPNEKDK